MKETTTRPADDVAAAQMADRIVLALEAYIRAVVTLAAEHREIPGLLYRGRGLAAADDPDVRAQVAAVNAQMQAAASAVREAIEKALVSR